MPYSPSVIPETYFEQHKSILTQNRGAGYWLWKPYIILKTLEEIPENDFVFYVDTGAILTKPIDSLVNHLKKADILVFGNWHTNKPYIKRDLLKMMNMDNEEVANSKQLQATFILIKNTKTARNIIKEWQYWSENEQAITDSPSIASEYPEFVAHRHDQSILTLLSLKHPTNFVVLSWEETNNYYSLHHRRRNVEDRSLALPYGKLNILQQIISDYIIAP